MRPTPSSSRLDSGALPAPSATHVAQPDSSSHIDLANYAGLTAGPLVASVLGLVREPVLVAAALLPPYRRP